MSAILILLAFFCFGAALAAALVDRSYKKKKEYHSDYWQSYWYDHFDEIRQTGLSRDQMERLHKLYTGSNDL